MDINFYKRLARDGVKGAKRIVKALDGSPDQPRDPDGKWSGGGGGGGGKGGMNFSGPGGTNLAEPGSNEHAGSEAAYAKVSAAHEHLNKNMSDPKAWERSSAAYHEMANAHEKEGNATAAKESRVDAWNHAEHAVRLSGGGKEKILAIRAQRKAAGVGEF
jgi:hypothetical protein